MDAFISRKKRKLPTPPSQTLERCEEPNEDDSTDFKLAILASLHPFIDQSVVLDILLAHNGSVEETSAALTNQESTPKKSATIGYQSSLSTYITPPSTTEVASKKAKLLSKRGRTLHLYSPEDVAAHTPCSIIHNFLPAEEANDLLSELLLEASTYQRTTFKLFDNIVQSPHTNCFYVEGSDQQLAQKTEYIYNGGLIEDVRLLTAHMRNVSPKVQEAVNREILTRIKVHYNGQKLQYQSSGQWRPNAAIVNCYSGGAESVGYHSDQLTYLGPHATIGSLSLGVTREFRVRRIVAQEEDAKIKSQEASDAEGQIAIHLPHNSLLIMHAEMQEEWKHSISPAQAIDPHPISGNRRINITYRDYKAALHPKFTPKCKCNVPAVLRVVQKKKENWGKYFWMCYAGNVPGKDGCNYFEWAAFDDDGNPIWKGEKTARIVPD